MRKITIVEVLDPIKNEFVPIRQAINQGLFNTKTYLFFNPVDKKHYSISEAAQRGIFKSAIDLRSESLIVERIKIAQTVSLIAARDPENRNRLVNIVDAIESGIVDPNLRIYRNTLTNEVIEMGDAIDAGLIQVKILRETTEKVKETLTEQKTTDDVGLIKKIETSSTSKEKGSESEADDDYDTKSPSLKQIDGSYVMDMTKSFNINKKMKRYDDDVTAGFISENDSRKILNQTHKKYKSILKSDPKYSAPLIDFNEALQKDLVILPDSLFLTQNVEYVIDLRTGDKIDFETACDLEIIDVQNRKYYDTRTNTSMSLFQALGKNYIIMKDELNNNYGSADDSLVEGGRNGKDLLDLDNLLNETNLDIYDISSVFNPKSGEQVQVRRAIELGLVDEANNSYIDVINNREISINEAVKKGLAVLKPDKLDNRISQGYEFLHIKGILNPITNQEMSLSDAIRAGFVDYAECEFRDPSTGKTLTLLDAYDKGYLITTVKKFSVPSSSSAKATRALKSKRFINKTNEDEANKENKAAKVDIEQQQEEVVKKAKLSETKQEPINFTQSLDRIEPVVTESSQKSQIKSRAEARSVPPSRFATTAHTIDQSDQQRTTRQRAQSIDLANLDKHSTGSKRSVILRLKDKLLGKKTKSNVLDQKLILKSMRFVDTSTQQFYLLTNAVSYRLITGEEKIVDKLSNQSYSIEEAIAKSLIKFFHPINNFEFVYENSCYIFGNLLLLVNYVLNPKTQKKIGLRKAFHKGVLDKYNGIYQSKKGPCPIQIAIQKGLICCEIVDLNTLHSIIGSAVSSSGMYQQQPTMAVKVNNVAPVEQVQSRAVDVQQLPNMDEHRAVEKLVVNEPDKQVVVENNHQQERNDTKSMNKTNSSSTIKLLEENKFISHKALTDLGIAFDSKKSYVITQVLDVEANKYVDLNEAMRKGLFDAHTELFYDKLNHQTIGLNVAIRTMRVIIGEHSAKSNQNLALKSSQTSLHQSQRTESIEEDLDDDSSRAKTTNTFKLIERDISPINHDSLNNNNNDDDADEDDDDDALDLTYESFKNSLNSRASNNQKKPIAKSNIYISEQIENFNLPKSLYYRKASNRKYLTFDRVVEQGLYDSETGLVKNQKNNMFLTINEALMVDLLLINDPNVLFDETKIYIVDYLMFNEKRITLLEGISRNLIDKLKCTYKYENKTYSISDAIKQQLIEGKILTNYEIKWILDNFATRVEAKRALNQSKISTSSKKSLEKIESVQTYEAVVEPVEESEKKATREPKDLKNSKSKKSSNGLEKMLTKSSEVNTAESDDEEGDFYVLDAESESYIQINEAFHIGILLSEPIRIKDASSANYVLLKDAVIKGMISTSQSKQRITAKTRSSFYTLNRISYIIDGVLDPRKKVLHSLQDAVTKGIFVNGTYKHSPNGDSYSLDKAISMGLVIGRRIRLENMDDIFKRSLSKKMISRPSKPIRGIYMQNQLNNSNTKLKSRSNTELFSSSLTKPKEKVEKKKRFKSQEPIIKSKIQPSTVKLKLIKDVASGEMYNLDEAEERGIIDFMQGKFRNTLRNEWLEINEAVRKGFILSDEQSSNFNAEKKSQKSQSSLLNASELSTSKQDIKFKLGSQFRIVSILDPVKKEKLELDAAIQAGLFDIGRAIYIDPRNKKQITMIDAIDQGLIKIEDDKQAANKLNKSQSNEQVKKEPVPKPQPIVAKDMRTSSISYVLDPVNQNVIPMAQAIKRKLVDIENDSCFTFDGIMTLRQAYEKGFALSADDLDRQDSSRQLQIAVDSVKKSTTGKSMTYKSALAKSWLNVNKNVYIDKKTNEEIPYSEAVNLGYLTLRVGRPESDNDLLDTDKSFNFRRIGKNGDSFQSKESTATSVKAPSRVRK